MWPTKMSDAILTKAMVGNMSLIPTYMNLPITYSNSTMRTDAKQSKQWLQKTHNREYLLQTYTS